MFDSKIATELAAALQTNETYIEKDWHLVRAVGVIASLDMEGVTPAFSGGTSLAAAWQLIHRFSEDIDFKVTVQAGSASAGRRMRSAYRDAVIEALTKAGFTLDGVPLIGNMSRFFRVSFHYGAVFPAATGMRPSLQIEMSFTGTRMPATTRPARSLLGRALKAPAEVPALLCVDPVETAADKISALAWRSAVRNRSSEDDDPTVMRHLHDLAPSVGGRPELPALALEILEADARRTGDHDANGRALLRAMLPMLATDPLWRKEYDEFVGTVSFGRDNERISFDRAFARCKDLVAIVLDEAHE